MNDAADHGAGDRFGFEHGTRNGIPSGSLLREAKRSWAYFFFAEWCWASSACASDSSACFIDSFACSRASLA